MLFSLSLVVYIYIEWIKRLFKYIFSTMHPILVLLCSIWFETCPQNWDRVAWIIDIRQCWLDGAVRPLDTRGRQTVRNSARGFMKVRSRFKTNVQLIRITQCQLTQLAPSERSSWTVVTLRIKLTTYLRSSGSSGSPDFVVRALQNFFRMYFWQCTFHSLAKFKNILL